MSGDPGEITATLLGFTRALRAAGLPVTADRNQTFLRAAAAVGVTDKAALYWAGRATLTADPEHRRPYDAVFEAWFGGPWPRLVPARTAPTSHPMPGLDDDARPPGEQGERHEVDVVRAAASSLDVLRHRDVAELGPGERALLAQLFAALKPVAPQRRALRRRPSHRGEFDVRRTLREELRRGGEVGPWRYRRPTHRPRKVVLLLDVSGSMSPYADALLRLAHRWVRVLPRQLEVFTIGTRLTRITRSLRQRDVELALREAGEEVPDWSGGTRLGEVLRAFLDRWGQRGLARGAVVVVCSDGWERGDPQQLAEQMHRLHRLAHRVVWLNPHRGKAGYRPVQAGIVAALPWVDDFVAGHSMATYAEVLEVVGRA